MSLAKGSGTLLDAAAKKINVHFDVLQTASGPAGTLNSGNLTVYRSSSPTASQSSDQESASTVTLDPILLSHGLLGSLQVFEVAVFGADRQPLVGKSVSLTSVGADGATRTLHAIAGATGKAAFTVNIATKATEYTATVDTLESNSISVKPVLQLK